MSLELSVNRLILFVGVCFYILDIYHQFTLSFTLQDLYNHLHLLIYSQSASFPRLSFLLADFKSGGDKTHLYSFVYL